MRAFLVSIIALAAMVCAGGLRSEAASTWPSMSWTGDQAGPSSNLVVKVKKKKKKHNDGGNDQKQDDGGNTIQQGERSCPEGYVVLKEKNMYGNFCEPKEGLPPPPKLTCAADEIGTPPNCRCRPGEACAAEPTKFGCSRFANDVTGAGTGGGCFGTLTCKLVQPGDAKPYQCCCKRVGN